MTKPENSPETPTYYQRHRAERLAYQKAYNQYFGAPYDPERYQDEREARLAYQRENYAANRETILPRNNAYYYRHKAETIPTFADGLPPGPHVLHCGQLQLITHIPHVCVVCGVRLSEKDVPHG